MAVIFPLLTKQKTTQVNALFTKSLKAALGLSNQTRNKEI